MPTIEEFHSIDLFFKVSQNSLAKIAQYTKKHYYKKSTVIFNLEQSQDAFSYIDRGWVKLFKESASGEEIIVDVLTATDYFGHQALFQESFENYGVQAISDLEVFVLPLFILKNLISEDHQLSINFLKGSLQKQKFLNMGIEHLSIQNAPQKIGCFILRLCNPGKKNDVTLFFPYDKALIASRLGMRAETFSRTLAKLSEECDIEISDHRIYIPNIQKLSDYVCQDCSKAFPCKD